MTHFRSLRRCGGVIGINYMPAEYCICANIEIGECAFAFTINKRCMHASGVARICLRQPRTRPPFVSGTFEIPELRRRCVSTREEGEVLSFSFPEGNPEISRLISGIPRITGRSAGWSPPSGLVKMLPRILGEYVRVLLRMRAQDSLPDFHPLK
jgi:hypothetical protein